MITTAEPSTANRLFAVVVVEDDRVLAAMMAEYLGDHGCAVAVEHAGDRAIPLIVDCQPDAVVLDVTLPGCDGFEVCRRVRERYDGPILMLTARGDEEDEVQGIMAGADDYLMKPLRPQALLARLLSHRRRPTTVDERGAGSELVLGDLAVHFGNRTASVGGVTRQLTTAEFDLLATLVARAGETISRQELSRTLLGLPHGEGDRTIDLRVSRLRKRLGDDRQRPWIILSVRNGGYQCAREPRRP